MVKSGTILSILTIKSDLIWTVKPIEHVSVMPIAGKSDLFSQFYFETTVNSNL
jgi:hypothetical protein